MQAHYYVVLLMLLIINVSLAHDNTVKPESFQPNQVVVTKAPDGYGDLYRVFLKKIKEGYLVQEFYLDNNQPATMPFVLSKKEDVTRLPKYYFDDSKLERLSIVGDYVRLYPNGQMERQGRYFNGERSGLWTHWYENGQKHLESLYTNGKLDGMSKTWLEDGSLSSEIFAEDGKVLILNSINRKDGKASYWMEFYKNGQAMQSGNMLEGKREGFWTFWDNKGRQEAIGYFQGGKRHGLWQTFWPQQQSTIKNTTYNTITVKRSEGEYKLGKKIGTWKYWDEDGKETVQAY